MVNEQIASAMKRKVHKSGLFFIKAALLVLFTSGMLPNDQPMIVAAGERQYTENHSSSNGQTGDFVITTLLKHNRLREARL